MRLVVIAQAEVCVITLLVFAVASTVTTVPSASIRLCWVKPTHLLVENSGNNNIDFVIHHEFISLLLMMPLTIAAFSLMYIF